MLVVAVDIVVVAAAQDTAGTAFVQEEVEHTPVVHIAPVVYIIKYEFIYD